MQIWFICLPRGKFRLVEEVSSPPCETLLCLEPITLPVGQDFDIGLTTNIRSRPCDSAAWQEKCLQFGSWCCRWPCQHVAG